MRNVASVPRIRGKNLLLLAFASLFAITTAACGDEAIGQRSTPGFEANPSPISFSQVNLGGSAQATVTITNSGEATLNLSNFAIVADGGGSIDAFSKGDMWPSSNEVKVEPGDFVVLSVKYAPTREANYRGALQMNTNVPDLATAKIPITTLGLAPELFSPRTINFSRTPAGDSSWQIARIENIGAAPLEIEHIFVNQGAPFKVTYPGPMVPGNPNPETGETHLQIPPPEQDSSSPATTTLRPGDEPIMMRVWFYPETDDPVSSELTIVSNDPRNPNYVINLSGNSGAACLEVTPGDELNFNFAPLGQTSSRAVTMRNCSQSQDLDLTGLTITDDGGGVYSIRENSYPGDLPDETLVLGPQDTANVVITFSPTEEIEYTGELLISSNDGHTPHFTLPIKGVGSVFQCPTAKATARVGSTSNWQSELTTVPPSRVEFSSQGSQNLDGGNLTYEWAIIGQPAGALAQLSPSNTVANPTLQVDIAGLYEIELTTFNDAGMASCETSVVQVFAIPGGDIHVELTWYSDGVAQPDDDTYRGTDLDLFYRHSDIPWRHNSTVYWSWKIQNWGSQGTARLDIDSLYGGRPENVKHENPADGRFYHVGVHYYNNYGNGKSYATLRIYLGDQLAFEEINHTIPNINDLWHAAIIQWGPNPQIIRPPSEWVTGHGLSCATCSPW